MGPGVDLVGDRTERVDQPVHTEFKCSSRSNNSPQDADNNACVIFPENLPHLERHEQQSNGFDPAAMISPAEPTGSAASSRPGQRDTP